MLFGKYQIVVFNENSGRSRTVRVRGWLAIIAGVGFVALIGTNTWLYQHYQSYTLAKQRLMTVEQSYNDQNTQFTNLASKLLTLQDDLERVRQFDSKLRVMMDLERDASEVSNTGAPVEETLVRGYLPLERQDLMVRKINLFLRQLATDIQLEEVHQQDLMRTVRANKELLLSLPSIWPVKGFITSRFGMRPSPFSGRRELHKGIDIAANRHTPILAPGAGVVVFSGVDGAYGNVVVMQHGNGITTRYAHMQRSAVKKGQQVQRADIIGYVGSTGRSTGPHVHYEVLLGGMPVNPLNYIVN